MPLSKHGVTGIGGKGKYPLNTLQKKSFTRSAQNRCAMACQGCGAVSLNFK
jgi:hypothetical protein